MQPTQPFKSVRRLGCGCMMVVLLLMVLGGCGVGFGLSHLWAKSASAAGDKVVRLSDVVSERARDGESDGEFVVSEVQFEYSGGEVWLSGTPNGRGELQTDDKAVLVVRHPDGSEASWLHEFGSADGREVLPLAAVDVSGLFEVGANSVTLRLSDLRPPVLSSTAYYLVVRANEENVRATRIKYETTQSATATVIEGTATEALAPSPTVSPNPTVVASPTVVPKKTVVASPTVQPPTPTPNPTAVASPIATASPTVVASPTTVVSPTATIEAVGGQGMAKRGSEGLLLPFGAGAALLLLLTGLRRRKREVPVVLRGWLDAYDDETGEMLALVSLSDYGREAIILRHPLRLITFDEFVGEELVVARIEAGDDGIGRLTVGFDEESIELGFETRLEIEGLLLEYRDPLAVVR